MPEWFFDQRVQDAIPYLVGGVLLFIVWLLSIKIWRAVFGRRVKSIGIESGMKFQDLDTMRRKGLISEEEYRSIRSTMARRETERMSDERRIEEERRIVAEAAYNPDAARRLITDAPSRETSAPAGTESGNRRQNTSRAPQPSMNNPRVVRARTEARTAAQTPQTEAGTKSENPDRPARDIDLLLQKGAITPEEYERLKKFFE